MNLKKWFIYWGVKTLGGSCTHLHRNTLYKRVARQWPVWIFLQYASGWVERSLVGYLAKLAGQIQLRGRSQTGPASLCSLLSSSGCRALQGIPLTGRDHRRLNVVDMETGVESIPLHVGKI
jgi:hypothetical protein